MSAALLQFAVAAFGYGLAAVAVVFLLERFGLLRDGAVAEIAWRIALYGGLVVASVQALAPTVREIAADLLERPEVVAAAPAPATVALPSSPVSLPETASAERDRIPAPRRDAAQAAAWTWSGPQAVAMLASWGSASAFALCALFAHLRQRSRYLRGLLRSSRAAPLHWQGQVDALSAASLHPVLRSVDAIPSPFCGDRRTILLPDWAETLDAEAQRALLAHELAHLRRRDPQWRVLDAFAVALMCALPPFRHAARRLEALAEFACDAEAARRSRAPQALAECIAQCLEHQFAATPRLAVAMATPASSVVERVQRLIEERPMFTSERPALRRSLIALSVAVALALPVVAINVAAEAGGASIHVESSSDGLFGARMQASFNEPGRKLTLKTRGEVSFNANEDDIATISDGGSLSIVETRDGVKRALSLESENGQLTRVYRVDGDTRPFDAEAKQWLAQTLPDVFRRTGLDAEARAKRIHARAGLDGLLDETALVGSDYARAEYLAAAFVLDRPDATQLARAVALARDIDSDYELRRALGLILAQESLDDAARLAVLRTATEIGSDYERAELLIDAAQRMPLDGEHLQAWRQAAADIGSDYELRRVLSSLLSQRDARPAHAGVAIAMAEGIGSDYEKRMLLEAAVDAGLGPTLTRSEYTRVAATISSDYERREALLKLIEDGQVDAALALDVLNAARGIGSDYEAKEVLVALARVMPAEAQVIEVYRSVARSLSTFERGQAEQALDRFVET
jgi:beta-lactamase regulating signal transducer with metallopeptidase domain